MSFPRYPEYKDSGVEWLGEVPAHWSLAPLKHAVRLVTTKATERVQPLGLENIESWTGRLLATSTEFEGDGVAFQDGDILFGKLRPYLAKVYVAEGPGEAVGDFHVLRPQEHCLSSFLQFQMLTRGFIDIVDGSTFGSKMPRASWDFVGSMSFTLPPKVEQHAIAAFLHRETAKIDALVAEQRRLMELLKEKRQAVISHAGTKGLNRDAPMKDSGMDLLGSVPAHWTVVALKRVADIRTGVAKGKDNDGKSTITVPYLRVANVQDGYLDLDTVTTIEIPSADLARYALRPGDVLMNEGGDFDKLGRGHVWDGQIDPCITQNHVFAVRPRLISSRWLNALTGTDYAQFYFMTRSKQSTNLASISSTNLMELPVLLPTKHEEEAILAFIQELRLRFDSLADEAKRAINVLLERRSALISAAVTGQIDVRGLASEAAA